MNPEKVKNLELDTFYEIQLKSELNHIPIIYLKAKFTIINEKPILIIRKN
jgi:hypothetical protein